MRTTKVTILRVDADDPLDEAFNGIEDEPHDAGLCFCSPRSRMAASAGESVSALKAEMAIEKAIVSENCL